MKNVYLLSANPMHYSHLNTWNTAERELHEKVSFCICENELKKDSLFSLEERAKIASSFYKIPQSRIVLLKNKNEIIDVIKNASKIIRGIRNDHDLAEMSILGKHYGVENFSDKLFLVEVPKRLKQISSSKLIDLIKTGGYSNGYNWVPEGLVKLIYKKLNAK